tara:strand:- start:32 stop:364 length:333 start_codon:yes stop_codon:yes gene_type:complete
MANPNLLNTTSIYGKNVGLNGNGSTQTMLTCPSDKLIKIVSINVHHDGSNLVNRIKINGFQVSGGNTTIPQGDGNYIIGGFLLTEGQTVQFYGSNSSVDCFISYEEIDDA